MTASANGSTEPLRGFQAGLTIGQAASTLGVSPSTVRRWVRSGRLYSDQVSVGDGFEYRIPLEALEAMKASANLCTDPSLEATVNGGTDASVFPALDASVERSAALAAYNAQLIAPLTAVIEQQSATIERQAERLEVQAETIGRQGAELEAERAGRAQLRTERDVAESSRRREARRLRIALAVVTTLAVAAWLIPAWVH